MRLGLHITIAAIASVLFAASAWAMFVESNAYVIGGDSSVARLANWTSDPVQPGWSIATQNQNLLDCSDVLASPNSLTMRFLDDATRAAIPQVCLTMADAITQAAPAASYAWYVGAAAAVATGDTAGFNHRLLRSQLTGANEQWIAEVRAALAEEHFAALTQDVTAQHALDLRMLVLSARGIRSIALNYAINPAFRDRIIAIVETLPANDQRRFLSQVRTALSGAR